MIASWRPVAVAAALNLIAGVGVAAAQTVIVRNAPAGAPLEIVFNTKTISTATADGSGRATLSVNMASKEIDARVIVDSCDQTRRILFVERFAETPPPTPGCTRRESVGFFVIRPVTTLVVDIAEPNLSVWLRQGPVPSSWLTEEAGASAPAVSRPSPTGLVVFGGGAFGKFRDLEAIQCGTAETCTGKTFRQGFSAGAVFWVKKWLGAEGTYYNPASSTISGTGTNYLFDTTVQSRMVLLAGNVGVPLGPVRIYGLVGANYAYAKNTTNNTIAATTITNADGSTTTVPGGTSTSILETAGWGYLFGGGMEGWIAPRFGFYAEGGRLQFKGTSLHGGEGAIDDRVTYITFGMRVHIGRAKK